MPMQYQGPYIGDERTRRYVFWLQSSRGTDEHEIIHIPKRMWDDDNSLKAECEEWCSQFACWNMSESCMSYGWRRATRSDR